MKMLQLVLLLGIVAFSHGQSCLSDPNPVTACTAEQVMGYLQNADFTDCYSLSILTDSGASCDDLFEELRVSLASLGSGACLPSSVHPEEGHGAAETGDAEDDAIEEEIVEPHPLPGTEDQGEVTPPPDPPADNECYTQADGSDYFGDMSVTSSGLDCQSWAEAQPHRPIRKYRGYGRVMHPALFGPHNHCRTLPFMQDRSTAYERNNFSGRSGPWCYTMNPDVRYEYCDVGEPQDSC